MSTLRAIAIGAAVAVCGGTALADPAANHTFSLSEAVDLALAQNPRLLASRRQANGARAGADSVRGHLLPRVKLGLTYDYVRANEGVDLGALEGGFGGGASSGSGGSGASSAPPPLKINFWGGDFDVSVAEPIVGLLHISQDYAASTRTADASDADVKTSEAEMRTQVELGLLSLFEARAEKGIAQASHDQLADQLQVAEAKFKDGTLTKADVLRVQVAAANAAQQVIQAQVVEDNSKDQLLGLLGLLNQDGTTVDFMDPTDELGRRQLPTLSGGPQEQFAEQHRSELVSAQSQVDSAWHRKQSGYLQLLPDFGVAYSYYRLINLPAGLPTDVNLFGMSASWNIWDWGSTYYAARAAGEQLEAANDQREAMRQQVDVEVRTRAALEKAAASAVQVASDTIAQAEEAFRVTEATVKAGAATTTDLLDSQAALTQAKLNLVRAKYEELRARSTLFRALGSGA